MNEILRKMRDVAETSLSYFIAFCCWFGTMILAGYAIKVLFALMTTFTPFGLAWFIVILTMIHCAFAATYPKLSFLSRLRALACVYFFLILRYTIDSLF